MQITLAKLEAMSNEELTQLITNMPKETFEVLHVKIKNYPVGTQMRIIFDKIHIKQTSFDSLSDIFSGLGIDLNGR